MTETPTTRKDQTTADFTMLLRRWQKSMVHFVTEFLGIDYIDPLQLRAIKAMQLLVWAKVKRWQKKRLSPKEAKVVDKIGISIMAGKGVGKDALMAWGIIWFLACFASSKIPMTGPSEDQVKDILLAEIAKWVNRLKDDGTPACMFPDLIKIQAKKVFVNGGENPGANWYAKIRVARQDASDEQKSRTLDGWHEDFMMVAVDEAASVSDAVFKAFDTTLSRPVNFVLMIFNPTRDHGYAYETHFGKRAKHWIRIHMDARQSTLVLPSQIEQIRDTYGEDSVEYQVNVCGNPPKGTSKSLIPYDRVVAATKRQDNGRNEPVLMGIDVARHGVDKSVVVVRQGFTVKEIHVYENKDLVEFADLAGNHIIDNNPERVYIDTCGVGAGTYDVLKRRFPGKLFPVDVNRKASLSPKQMGRPDRIRFNRLRDELYWRVRQAFIDGLFVIPKNQDLIKELASIREEDTEDGRLKIESKVRLKRRGGKSPNIADALMITMMGNIQALRARKRDSEKAKHKKQKSSYTDQDMSWLMA